MNDNDNKIYVSFIPCWLLPYCTEVTIYDRELYKDFNNNNKNDIKNNNNNNNGDNNELNESKIIIFNSMMIETAMQYSFFDPILFKKKVLRDLRKIFTSMKIPFDSDKIIYYYENDNDDNEITNISINGTMIDKYIHIIHYYIMVQISNEKEEEEEEEEIEERIGDDEEVKKRKGEENDPKYNLINIIFNITKFIIKNDLKELNTFKINFVDKHSTSEANFPDNTVQVYYSIAMRVLATELSNIRIDEHVNKCKMETFIKNLRMNISVILSSPSSVSLPTLFCEKLGFLNIYDSEKWSKFPHSSPSDSSYSAVIMS